MAGDRLGGLDGRRVARARGGRDGRGHGPPLAAPASPTSGRGQPHVGRGPSSRGRAGRRPRPSTSTTCPAALADVDVLLTSHRLPPRSSSSTATSRPWSTGRAGRPLLIVDMAVPRDVDPAVGALARRDPARHGRPAGLRRGRPGRAPRGGRPGPRPSSTTRSSRFLDASSARAGRARWSPPCAIGPRSCGWPSWPASGPARRPRPAPAGGGRGRHPGSAGQAPARADGAAQGGGRLGPGRAPRRGPARALRPVVRPAHDGRCGRHPGEPAGPWQTDHVAALLRGRDAGRRRARPSSSRPSATARRTPPIWRDRAARASSSRRCRPPCSTGGPTSPSTRPRTCRRPPPPGLVIAAVPERGDPRDALVGGTLDDLPPGARVATGSVRRRAQLAWLRPDLTFAGLRGNMDTRLAKAPRLRRHRGGRRRPRAAGRSATRRPRCSTPRRAAPGRARAPWPSSAGTTTTAPAALLAAIEHGPAGGRCEAERAFLAELGGGCDLPGRGLRRRRRRRAADRLEGLTRSPATAASSSATATPACRPRTSRGRGPWPGHLLDEAPRLLRRRPPAPAVSGR